MRKAKIMLTAIAIIGLLSGALALGAKNSFNIETYYTCNTATKTCAATTTMGFITTVFTLNATATFEFATTNSAANGKSCTLSCSDSDFVYVVPGD